MELKLCYNKEKELLYISEWSYAQDILFESYDKKGYSSNKPQFVIPQTNFSIKIETNFGYNNASYLRALMCYNSVPLLNFDNWCDSLNGDLHYFQVEATPDNWKELFQLIIKVYNERDSWNNNNTIKGLEQIIDLMKNIECINVRPKPYLPNKGILNGNIAIIHFAKKIQMILYAMHESKLDEHLHIKELLNIICKQMLLSIPPTYRKILNGDAETLCSQSSRADIKHLESCFSTIYNYLQRSQQLFMFFQ